MSQAEAGWYADPLRRAELRWYHGAGWGEQVRTGAVAGIDPIDEAGAPRWPAPQWASPAAVPAAAPATPVGAAVPGGRMGRGTKTALSAVLVAFVLLVGVAVVAILVLVRNVPRLTTDAIEDQVATAMSEQLGSAVTVDCPPVVYIASSDGTVECTATSALLRTTAQVEVTIRNAKVVDWEIIDTEPGA